MSSVVEVIRVILIDDHRHIHNAVSLLLDTVDDIQLIGQGSNGSEALQLCKELGPDVILMDVVMPGMSGLEATLRISEQHPTIKILVLSSFEDHESVRTMLKNGAVGYILKSSLVYDLVNTICATFHGKSVFSPEIINALLHAPASDKDFSLTEREREVLTLITRGMNNNEIADLLVISRSTVKFHLNNILLKMHVETRAEAIVLATRNNL